MIANPWANIDMNDPASIAGAIPAYNPYAGGTLDPSLTYKPQTMGYQNLNPMFDNARSDLYSDHQRGIASARSNMMMRGGADSGSMERLNKNSQGDLYRSMGRLYGDQAATEAGSRYQTDLYNTNAMNDASKMNIGTILGEKRFGHASDLDRFKTGMDVYGSHAVSQNMDQQSKQKDGLTNWWDTNIGNPVKKNIFDPLASLGSPLNNLGGVPNLLPGSSASIPSLPSVKKPSWM